MVFELETSENKNLFCLKLLRNLHSLKDIGHNYFEFLEDSLISCCFRWYQIDLYLCTRDRIIIVVCADDHIISRKAKEDMELLLKFIKEKLSADTNNAGLNLMSFSFTNNRDVTTFLKIKIDAVAKKKHMHQSRLMQYIIRTLGLQDAAILV